ncbi:hypothetical protein GCM10017673_40300 [Streptosporangium violaceochromogenes]|nr:hypothetical protein GCM10017673_40300 [Streptosporangium violaceochromogenes]
MADDFRMLPHDIEAEMAALGAAMLTPHAANVVFTQLSADHFYRTKHRPTFRAIVDLYRRGEPVDVLSVRAELERVGNLADAGGQVYISELSAFVPTSANIGYYVNQVRELGTKRIAIEELTRITEQGYADFTTADDLVTATEDAITRFRAMANDSDVIEGFSTLGSFIDESDEDHDWLVPGVLERMDRVIVVASEGAGKALALDTPIPTPKGWTTMGELSAGDEVFGPDGKPARVTFATPVMTGRDCFRVRFSDDTEIIADAEHLWVTETLQAREAAARHAKRNTSPKGRGTDQRHKRRHFPAIVTTADIATTLHARDGHTLNHSIEVCRPLEYPPQELPLAPYTLGAWLGDGTSACAEITCADVEILDRIRADGYAITTRANIRHGISNPGERERRVAKAVDLVARGMGVVQAARHAGVGKDAVASAVGARPSGWRPGFTPDTAPQDPYLTVQEHLRRMGVLGDKHIPEIYQRASVNQRLALLQGLMDTDGTVDRKGGCEFSVTNERLARDVHELLLGLGIKVSIRSGPAKIEGRETGTRWRLAFQSDLPVFCLPRKADRLSPLRTRRAKLRYITAVEPVISVPVRCIQVDHPDRMYLAGRACIPTHNTTLARQIAVQLAAGVHPFSPHNRIPPVRTLYIDLENPPALVRRKVRHLVNLGRQYSGWDDDRAWRWTRPGGIDLRKPHDQHLVDRVIVESRAEFVAMGPLYKAFNESGEKAETINGQVARVLDGYRERHGIALWLETHAPMEQQGQRSLRPMGSGVWSRWPEFGLAMRKSKNNPNRVHLERFRGDRDERSWPHHLERSSPWPWAARWDGGFPVEEAAGA